MSKIKNMKEKFDELYEEWEKYISNPKIQMSSRPRDYTDNEPYNKIIELGTNALPYILEKIEQGIFFMNEAALKISKKSLENLIDEELELPPSVRINFLTEKPPKFLGEKQKSKLILKNLKK